jgi:hypothetical protein
MLGFIKSNVLEWAVEKEIAEIVESWNWEIDLARSDMSRYKPEKCGHGY